MTPKEIQILQRACQVARIDASKIKPENPFTKSGSTATLLQAAVGEFAPEQAAKWRCEAGGGLSVQTLSEIQAGGDLSDAAMNDLWLHDHQFVADRRREQSSAVEKQLAWLDAEADKKRRAREGDKAVETVGLIKLPFGVAFLTNTIGTLKTHTVDGGKRGCA